MQPSSEPNAERPEEGTIDISQSTNLEQVPSTSSQDRLPREAQEQRSNQDQLDSPAAQVTYNIDSSVTNNNFTFGTSSSVPNITINVTASPPGAKKRARASEDEDGTDGEAQDESYSTRLRARTKGKRVRTSGR